MSQHTKDVEQLDLPSVENIEESGPARLFVTDDAKSTGHDLPEVVVYGDANFSGGDWRFNFPPNWGWGYVGDAWNDRISSVVVVSGTWAFFEHAGFQGARTVVGPGYYKFVEDGAFNMVNDSISSILCLNDAEPVSPVVDI